MRWFLVLIPETLSGLTVSVDSLRPYGRNPRRGNVALIAESLQANGQYRPVVANKRTGEVLAGNHTLAAARSLGWAELAVTWVDVDDEAAARIALVDNRASDLAGFDDQVLADLLRELPDLVGTGYTDDDLADLLSKVTELPPVLADPDDAPEPPTFPVSELGDVWVLGRHRLVCGDSSDVNVHDAVLGGDTPGMVLTDPPYGMFLTADWSSIKGLLKSLGGGRTSGNKYDDVIGDHEDFDPAPYLAMYAGVKEQFWFGADYYAERITGKNDGSWLVWDKRKDTQADAIGAEFELCWSKQKHKRRMLRHDWFGFLASGSNASDARNRVHPTQKPVSLFVDIMEQWGKADDIVLDMFGGSGSTLVACHQLDRAARLIELDPRYVDVICRRYQEVSGDKPVLESTGEPHDFTAS